MDQDRTEQRLNPFSIGLVGVLLVVAGCIGLQALAAPADEATLVARLQQAAQTQGTRTDPATLQTLARAEGYYRPQLYWKLAAQLVFFAGVAVVVAAGIAWYQQAQQPEPASEPEESDLEHASNEG